MEDSVIAMGDVTNCDKNIMQVVFSLVAVYYAVSHCVMAGVVEGERNIPKKNCNKKVIYFKCYEIWHIIIILESFSSLC